MTEDMQVRNLSSQTQATYVQQVSLFARHFNKSPEILGPEETRSYQVYLTNGSSESDRVKKTNDAQSGGVAGRQDRSMLDALNAA